MTGTRTADWDLFRTTLRAEVSPVTWQTWLASLDFDAEQTKPLVIYARSDFHLQWVRDKHMDTLRSVAWHVYGRETDVQLKVHPEQDDAAAIDTDEDDPPPISEAPAPVLVARSHDARLSDRYSFDNFVVGPSNRFAHAAAMAVAEQPGRHYNPLFIYGGAGLGKTHLLNALGHHSLELNPRCVVRYVTSESFFNEFIDGIRRKRMDEFKNRFRTTDVLLLDDVQFFEGKEQILEEFFHTFNSLYEAGKHVVISADRHPRDLISLEDRLRSRFEWGLLTDIQPPDVETRLAILRTNVSAQDHTVPEEVLEFIAHHVADNIRELEGALTRVTAYGALHGTAVELDMARDVLQDLLPSKPPKPLGAEDVLLAAAAAYEFSTDEVVGPSRRQPLVLCRQVAMYICRDLTDLSLPKIGAAFGGRDHTTVIHAIDKVTRLMKTDHEVFDRVTALSQQLRRT